MFEISIRKFFVSDATGITIAPKLSLTIDEDKLKGIPEPIDFQKLGDALEAQVRELAPELCDGLREMTTKEVNEYLDDEKEENEMKEQLFDQIAGGFGAIIDNEPGG